MHKSYEDEEVFIAVASNYSRVVEVFSYLSPRVRGCPVEVRFYSYANTIRSCIQIDVTAVELGAPNEHYFLRVKTNVQSECADSFIHSGNSVQTVMHAIVAIVVRNAYALY